MDSFEERKQKRYTFHPGKPAIYTPEELAPAIAAYVEQCQDNLLYEEVLQKIKTGGGSEKFEFKKLSKAVIMTVVGCCNFLKISDSTWYDYAKDERYSGIITRAGMLFKQQRAELAAAGLVDAPFIARLDGMVDKQDHTSSDGSMSPKVEIKVQDSQTASDINKLK